MHCNYLALQKASIKHNPTLDVPLAIIVAFFTPLSSLDSRSRVLSRRRTIRRCIFVPFGFDCLGPINWPTLYTSIIPFGPFAVHKDARLQQLLPPVVRVYTYTSALVPNDKSRFYRRWRGAFRYVYLALRSTKKRIKADAAGGDAMLVVEPQLLLMEKIFWFIYRLPCTFVRWRFIER